jgi:hypothetical protein
MFLTILLIFLQFFVPIFYHYSHKSMANYPENYILQSHEFSMTKRNISKLIECNYGGNCGRKFGCDTALMRHYADKHPYAREKQYKLPCGCAFVKQRGRTADQMRKLHVCGQSLPTVLNLNSTHSYQQKREAYALAMAEPPKPKPVKFELWPNSIDVEIEYSIHKIPPKDLK